MKYQESIRDPVISQKVSEKLSSLGVRAPCRVMVVSNKGRCHALGDNSVRTPTADRRTRD